MIRMIKTKFSWFKPFFYSCLLLAAASQFNIPVKSSALIYKNRDHKMLKISDETNKCVSLMKMGQGTFGKVGCYSVK